MPLLALVLPALASHQSYDEALIQPYSGYCAQPPLAQQEAIVGPPADEVLKYEGLRLVGVQIIFRHGARDLSSDKPCFSNMAPAKNCSVQRMVSFKVGNGETEQTVPLLRQVLDAYPSMEKNMPGSGYISQISGCGKGVLLNDAVPQTMALADSIEQKYFGSLPSVPTLETTRMYSTGKERTQATLFLLQNHLFKNDSTRNVRTRTHSFYSRPVSSDPWDLNQHCPRVGHMRHARHFKTDPQLIQSRFPSFARKWTNVTGTQFQASFKDCLLVAQCSKQEALRAPEGLQPDSELFKEALTISLKLFQEHYSKDPETVKKMQLLAAPALMELDQVMQQQAQNARNVPNISSTDHTPLALWATHDTTILVMLVALGLWDGQWPPYTDVLVLEVYETSDGRGALFRLLHRSTVLQLPWCRPESTQIPGLCSVTSFLPAAIQRFRDLKVYRQVCSTTEALVPDATEQDAALAWPGASAASAAFLTLWSGLFCAAGWKIRGVLQSKPEQAHHPLCDVEVAAEYRAMSHDIM